MYIIPRDPLFIMLGAVIHGNSIPRPIQLCLAKNRKCESKTFVVCKWALNVEVEVDLGDVVLGPRW